MLEVVLLFEPAALCILAASKMTMEFPPCDLAVRHLIFAFLHYHERPSRLLLVLASSLAVVAEEDL